MADFVAPQKLKNKYLKIKDLGKGSFGIVVQYSSGKE